MKILSFILSILPGVLQSIMAVEAAIGAGKGQTKKAVVMSAITAAAQAGEQIAVPQIQAVSATIDAVVAGLNKSGLFGTSGTSAPASTNPPA